MYWTAKRRLDLQNYPGLARTGVVAVHAVSPDDFREFVSHNGLILLSFTSFLAAVYKRRFSSLFVYFPEVELDGVGPHIWRPHIFSLGFFPQTIVSTLAARIIRDPNIDLTFDDTEQVMAEVRRKHPLAGRRLK